MKLLSKVHKACDCVFQNNAYIIDSAVVEVVRTNFSSDNYEEPRQVAEEIINDAKDRAFELVEEAQKEALTILDNTKESAYNEGFEKGKNEALAEFSGIINQAFALLGEMQKEKCSYLDKMKPELVNLSIRIAEKVINQKIASDKSIFSSMVSATIAKIQGCEELQISVNPVQFDEFQGAKSKLLSGLKSIKSIEIIADEALDENGCLIKTECGSIDAGVKTMIGNINEAFSEKGGK